MHIVNRRYILKDLLQDIELWGLSRSLKSRGQAVRKCRLEHAVMSWSC